MNEAEAAQQGISAAHLIYIPLCVLVGVVLGWLLGGRSVKEELRRARATLDRLEQRQQRERLDAGRAGAGQDRGSS